MAGQLPRNGQRGRKAARLPDIKKLQDPKYALALHIARGRRERRKGVPPAR